MSQLKKPDNNVQLPHVESRPRGIKPAIDEVHTLPLTPPKGGSNSEFIVM